MKREKIKDLLAAFLLGACSLFCGCHGSKGQAEFVPPKEFDTTRDYEITFWAKNDTNKTQTRIYEQAIADFEMLYPNITVKLRLYSDYGRIYNDVITNISTNTTPNVCITYPDHIATYLTGNNSVVPLDDLFVQENYGLAGKQLAFVSPAKEQMIAPFLEECRVHDRYYAVPYMRSTEACYINKTYVNAMGYEIPEVLTWDFIWEVSEAAMKKAEDGTYVVNGQNLLIPFIYKSTDNMMIQMLRQKNAGYSNEEGEILLFHEESKNLLYTIAEHTKTGAFSTFKVSSYPGNFLNAGQCIFAVDSTAGATWIGSHAPNADISEDKFVEFETQVMPIPQFDTEHPKMISQGPSVCIFNKADPQEVVASWLFVQYLLTNEVQTAYAKTEGYVPVTKTALESKEYQEYLEGEGEDDREHYAVKIQASKLLLSHLEDTFVTPVFNGSASLRDAAGQMIENVVKSTNRKQTVDDAYMEKMFKEVTSLYRLDSRNDTNSSASGKQELGPLPAGAVALLLGLGIVWLILLFFFIRDKVKSYKIKN